MEKEDYLITNYDYKLFGVAMKEVFNDSSNFEAIKHLTTTDSTIKYGLFHFDSNHMEKIINPKELEELRYEHMIINNESYSVDLGKLLKVSNRPIDTAGGLNEDSVAFVGFSKPVFNDSKNLAYFVFEYAYGSLNGEGLLLIMQKLGDTWEVIYRKQVSVM